MFLFLFSCSYKNSNNEPKLQLSEVEKRWIQEHPIIRVANQKDWPPFDFNESGKPKGFVIDYIKLLSRKAGFKINFISGFYWTDLIELFKQKKIDVMPVFYKNDDRMKFTLYSMPYFEGRLGIFVVKGKNKESFNYKNKRIAMETSHGSIPIIKKMHPGISIIKIDSKEILVRRLASRKLDYIIGNPFVFYYHARENQINNIQLLNYIDVKDDVHGTPLFHIGIRKDWKVFHGIIEKAIKNVSDNEMRKLRSNWVDISIVTKVNWTLIFQISFLIIVIVLFLIWHNRRLQSTVKLKTNELMQFNESLESIIKERTAELTNANEKLKLEIEERQKTERALMESEVRFKALHNASFGGISIHDNGIIIDCNQGLSEMTGFSIDELIGMNGLLLISEDTRDFVKEKILSGYEKPYEAVGLCKDGETYSLRLEARNIPYKNKTVRVVEFRDITEVKKSQKFVKQQLEEKELLLREVNHRIKNNISSIKSMLSLQLSSVENEEASNILIDTIGRIESMVVIYGRLSFSDDFVDMSVKQYIEELLVAVMNIFSDSHKISLSTDVDDFNLNVKKLFPLGTILNELITNSMKYAFIDKDSGAIEVTIKKSDNTITLSVFDNGLGLPHDFDKDESPGLGLMLVKMLTQQLKGNMSMESSNGTQCIITFDL